MFKLNNKGFAFSTILYGLMLMGIMIIICIMSIMQTNRVTNKKYVENIEKELNRFSLTESNFTKNDTNAGQEYIVPVGESGWYKIELWGAQGASNGGLGAYTSGLIWLKENTHLYFYVGSQAGFNGGGAGSGGGSNGGGATDVRLASGEWNSNLDKRIMVAAGGGGSGSSTIVGGSGGAILGLKGGGTTPGNGGMQSAGSFGQGTNASGSSSGGGGSGYYGGSGATGNGGGGGGSSYISGYAGVVTKDKTGKEATYYHVTTDESSYTNGVFINGVMLAGVRSGDGAARISKVSTNGKDTPPTQLNTKLYGTNIKFVKDCTYGSKTANTTTINNNYWSELQVVLYGKDATGTDLSGKNIAAGRPYIFTASGGSWSGSGNSNSDLVDGKLEATKSGVESNKDDRCVVLQLDKSYNNISEIAVWHDYVTENQNTINHRLFVSNNGSSWTAIASSADSSLESYETSNGFHYSSWQPDSTIGNIDDGTYYIMSAASDNLFVTSYTLGSDAKFYRFTGDVNQRWNIRKSTNGYLITTVDGGAPLHVMNGTFYDGSSIGIDSFIGLYQWNQWYLKDAGNGTYYIYAIITDQFGVTKETYLGTNFDDNIFYNKSKTVYGKTFVNSNQSSIENAPAINRLLRVRLISVNY